MTQYKITLLVCKVYKLSVFCFWCFKWVNCSTLSLKHNICRSFDANLNRHVLRPNKQYWNNCPRKLKFRFLIENPDPTIIIETRTEGISITPWPSDYNWITDQRYKVWTPQGRISDKFTVLEEPKEEQSLTFSDFYSIAVSITMSACYL